MSIGSLQLGERVSKTVVKFEVAVNGVLPVCLVLWLSLKDWFVSNIHDYPYTASLLTALGILAAALAAWSIRQSKTGQFTVALIAMTFASIEIVLHYTIDHLDHDLSIKISDVIGGWLNGNTLTAIGMWAFAVSLPPLVGSLVCRLPQADRAAVGLRSLLSLKLDVRALYVACAIAGFFCLARAHDVGTVSISDCLIATLIALCISVCLLLLRLQNGRHGVGAIVTATIFCACIGSYFYELINALAYPAAWTRTFLLGTGLTSDYDRSTAAFIGEQGIVTWAAGGLLLTIAGLRSLSNIRKMRQHSVMRCELELAATSLIVIVLFDIFGLTFTNELTILISGLAIASLFITVPRQDCYRLQCSKLAYSIMGAFIVGILVWLVGLYRLTENLAGAAPNNIAASFCSWKYMPETVRNTTSGIPIRPTLIEDHLLLRYFCSANVGSPNSMTSVIAIQQTRAYAVRNPFSGLAALVLEHLISNSLTDERIKELYLNCRSFGTKPNDYGHEIIGISDAASYFFRAKAADLNNSESRFLIASYPACSEPRFVFQSVQRPPVLDPPALNAYRYTEFSRLPDMIYMMHVGQINNRGCVACSVVTYNGGTKPFNWKAGHFIMLPGLAGPADGLAAGINDTGTSVGSSKGCGVRWHDKGIGYDLGLLQGFNSNSAMAINNRDQIAGYCYNDTSTSSDIENASHAYLWENGSLHDLGVPPGYISTRAYAINNNGLIAGFAITTSGKSHAVVWENEKMHDLGTYPDGDISRATSINDAGEVVGQGTHDNGTVTAFLWRAGVMHDLGTLPGDRFTRARSINDQGTIVGESRRETINPDATGGRSFIWDAAHGMRDLMPMVQVDPSQHHALELACAAFSINNRGQILGINRRYPDLPGKETNFVLNPLKPF